MVHELPSSATETPITHKNDDGLLWVLTMLGDAQDNSLAKFETCPITGYIIKITTQVVETHHSKQ